MNTHPKGKKKKKKKTQIALEKKKGNIANYTSRSQAECRHPEENTNKAHTQHKKLNEDKQDV